MTSRACGKISSGQAAKPTWTRDITDKLGAFKEEFTEESWERAKALLQSKGEYPEPR